MNRPPIIIVGNFAPDAQQSMLRFARLVDRELGARGVPVRITAPEPRFARLARPYRYSGWPKLLGYIDKFVLFPRTLRRLAQQNPGAVFHIVDHANAVYLPHLPARTVVTCHDLLQIRAARGELAGQNVGRSGRRYQEWIRRSLARSPLTACVSWATRRDLIRIAGVSPARVVVVPNGLNHDFRRVEPGVAWSRLAGLGTGQVRLAPDEALLLNVGGGQWYKNRPGLLRIFHALRAEHHYDGRLVMVGKPLSATDRALADSLGLGGALVSLQDVSADVLEALYSVADGLVFPSWEEGFGWPVLEAQACGCRVFTSNRAPMTEVGGEGAVYFDPADPAGAAAVVAARLRDTPACNEPGLRNARNFTTAAMIDGYLELYARVAHA